MENILSYRRLSLGLVFGPFIFIIASIVLCLLRPDYSMQSQPLSALAIGFNGGFMRAAFIIEGLFSIIGLFAVFRGLKNEFRTVSHWICAALLIISPFGILWAGIFTMKTLALHMVGAQLAMATPIIVFPIAGFILRHVPDWRRLGTWMIAGGPITLALLVGFMMSIPFSEMVFGGGNFGLWQRALMFEVFFWYVAIGWLAFHLFTPEKQ